MLIAGLAFIGYAVVFFIRSFTGTGFELGVETLNGVTKEQLNALNPRWFTTLIICTSPPPGLLPPRA